MGVLRSQRIVVICEKTMFPLNLYLRVNNNRFKTDQFVKYSMEV